MICTNCHNREAGTYTEGGIKTSLCDTCFRGQFSPRNILFVSERDREAISTWPIELRALFDPQADRELAEKISRENNPTSIRDDEIPF